LSVIPPVVPNFGPLRVGFRFAGFEFAAIGARGVRMRISEHTMERIRRSIRRATRTDEGLDRTHDGIRTLASRLAQLLGSSVPSQADQAEYRFLFRCRRNREIVLQARHLDRFLARRLRRYLLPATELSLDEMLDTLARRVGMRPRSFSDLLRACHG
jgi:hypothetical protein